jgi:hypothetical protein
MQMAQYTHAALLVQKSKRKNSNIKDIPHLPHRGSACNTLLELPSRDTCETKPPVGHRLLTFICTPHVAPTKLYRETCILAQVFRRIMREREYYLECVHVASKIALLSTSPSMNSEIKAVRIYLSIVHGLNPEIIFPNHHVI